ncbi:TIM barrel protein [Martelella sp. AD-3]|uniref:TIM barrel protein n=1 Tax=Martelella sp. AD-3 TaxID=686597 RepID=UPI0004651358|nr:TIM barrel protein [Martelella sp. AD-3]AMM84890.1 hydroxypyruvate isomerase [Martelella sp. AD-3]MAM11147.1 hydroxypyruvate isomerase [Rhizobiaceae bacterium]
MPQPEFSPCLEWLFAEPGDSFTSRIERAAAAGFTAFEFWLWSNKDVEAIARAAKACDMAVAGLVAEPLIAITDPVNRTEWLDGLKRSVEVANRLEAPVLIAQTGNDLPQIPRRDQKAALIETFSDAADVLIGSGVRLGIEPLNTIVDHPGYFLHSTAEGFEIVEAVNRDEIGLLYDLYHAAVMEEPIETVLAGNLDKVVHVHVADHPGRNEPGSGGIDLADRLAQLIEAGYRGRIGLEYKPLAPGSDAVIGVRDRLSQAVEGRR